MNMRADGQLLAAAVLASVALILTPEKALGRGEELLGKPPPAFSESSVNKGFQSLAAFKGKVVLLDFWSTWCVPCVKEMPNVKRLYDRFKGKDFVLLGISLDSDRSALNSFLRKNGIDWPILFDGKGWKNRIAVLYDVRSIPFTVLVDRSGVVRKVGLRGTELENAIAAMLQ
jgi:thiol-disulfide isomerase/thioredoxin